MAGSYTILVTLFFATLTCGSPIQEKDDLLCIVSHCGIQLYQCVLDSQCLKVLQCLQV